jgi:heterotetrameric sarcosine oxidase delta subunit
MWRRSGVFWLDGGRLRGQTARMSFVIECPNCGPRPSTDFRYGGEVRPAADPNAAPEVEARRLWMRRNVAGDQRERWFHRDGCRRWLTITRNTLTNIVEP